MEEEHGPRELVFLAFSPAQRAHKPPARGEDAYLKENGARRRGHAPGDRNVEKGRRPYPNIPLAAPIRPFIFLRMSFLHKKDTNFRRRDPGVRPAASGRRSLKSRSPRLFVRQGKGCFPCLIYEA